MNLHTLPKITDKTNKRLGRGHGSGRGKTSGRGTKGQKARRDIPLWFEGGARSIIKRLPFRRGHAANKSLQSDQIVVNVEKLSDLPAKSVVTVELLAQHGLVDLAKGKDNGVKILGKGELTVPLTVQLATSKSAREKIEKAGGTIELGQNKTVESSK